MTDKELLELAAKAAGIKIEEWCGNYAIVDGRNWHPLSEDGDAFQLLVDLDLDITCYLGTRTISREDTGGYIADGKSNYVGTRRAIVRAAAEIGGAM